MDTTALPVRVTNRFRLAKRDDAGVIVEFVCFGEGRDTVTVTPTSDPEEFERLLALDHQGAPAE